VFSYLVGGYDKNFTYFLGCQETKELAVIDPADYQEKIQEQLDSYSKEGFKLTKIFLTHAHPDHILSLSYLKDKYPRIKIFGHALDSERIKDLSKVLIDHEIQNHEIIKLGNESIEAFYTPGHQESSTCFIWREKIFTGDTLFVNGCGRCDLPGGDIKKQLDSLRYLANQVSENLLVCSGHNYGDKKFSTLGEQKQTNPYLINLVNSKFDQKAKEKWLKKRKRL